MDPLGQLSAALSSRYRIESEIGRGGMATVYLAHDMKHNRQVAIKVLKQSLAEAIGPERFLREIEIVAGLTHPHILPLHDSGDADGLLYYVMPYVEGESLQDRLDRDGRLPLGEAVRVTTEVAGALAFAHERGVIHRDVKPGNILFQAEHALLADFGIAQAASSAEDARLTEVGVSLGTPTYMSPEQAMGEEEVDGRTDIYALGCMLYELLTGEAPFEGSSEVVVRRKIVGEFRPLKEVCPEVPAEIDRAVTRALETDPAGRFATAGEFRDALLAGMPTPGVRRRILAVAGVALLVVVAAGVAVIQNRAESQRRVRVAEALAEVERLVDGGYLEEALDVAREVEALSPGDTTLARLYPSFTFTIPIRTDPPGATVYMQDWGEEAGEWELLGVTPLEEVRLAGTVFEMEARGYNPLEDVPHRFRFELEGYETRELLGAALIGVEDPPPIPPVDPVVLQPLGTELEGMVRLPGLPDADPPWRHGPYFMDRYEVTNGEFKEFVDAGGYENPDYWEEPFVLDEVEVGFAEAMGLFVDQTGRPGPSTWHLGSFPEGQADYPVGGVSWYEAAAYARWAGKELPAMLHWNQANPFEWSDSRAIFPRSNLGSDGPRPVGQGEAMTSMGVYDLVGNVREWCANPGRAGGRITRGGAWTDAPFLSGHRIPRPAMDRDPTNGFRLVRTFEDREALEAFRRPVGSTATRDYRTERPASDAEFEIFRRMYAYDRLPLNPVVERVDTFQHWVREKVVFQLSSGEGGGVVLYLPRDMEGPFQPIVYFGGTEILHMTSIEEEFLSPFEFLPRAGRVVAVPLYKGTYGRQSELPPGSNFPGGLRSNTYRDATITWVQEVGRVIDYLEIRPDMDAERVGYYGFSHGGLVAPILLSVEPRIKAGVVNVGGLHDIWRFQPEIDPINFVTRVRTPTLMINGRYDIIFPYETAQLPMYELLGTAPEDKRHYVAESGHIVPKDELIRETLAWFDRYLGVPGGG